MISRMRYCGILKTVLVALENWFLYSLTMKNILKNALHRQKKYIFMMRTISCTSSVQCNININNSVIDFTRE